MSIKISPFRRIGILGLGLIGGSIAKTIKALDPSISLFSLQLDDKDLKQAADLKYIDSVFANWPELLENIELLVLAIPLSKIIGEAEKISTCSPNLSHPLLVIDVGSVKTDVVNSFEQLSCQNIEFLATHPMTGKEQSGFEHSTTHLFNGAPWIITPHKKNSAKSIDQISMWIEFLGAKAKQLDAVVHDQQVALISHLPYLIAKHFYDFVMEKDPNSLSIAGPGFRSFSRIAFDNPKLREEIFSCNQHQIRPLLKDWLTHFLNESGQTDLERGSI